MKLEYDKDNKERIPYEHYLEKFKSIDPIETSKRCNVIYNEENKEFYIRLMNYSYLVKFPTFEIRKENENEEGFFMLLDSIPAKIIVLRFLIEGRYVQGTGKYITYREVPWGEVYFRNFEGRCLMRLKFAFGFNLSKFEDLVKKIGGIKMNMGDVGDAFEFINNLLIRFALCAVAEEFARA